MRHDIVEVHARGMNFDTYRKDLRVHAEIFDSVYRHLEFVLKAEFARAPFGSSRILVLTEDFCIDSVLNLPLIARLAEASPNAHLSIVRRDGHQALALEFPGRDNVSRVPTVVFISSQGEVQGHWSERSGRDQEWMAAFVARNPIPPITLEDGHPTPILADWMKRRFDAQLPFLLSEGWSFVRDELSAIATSGMQALKSREKDRVAKTFHG